MDPHPPTPSPKMREGELGRKVLPSLWGKDLGWGDERIGFMFKLNKIARDKPNSWRTDNLPAWGLFFVAPWIVGFIAFTVYPFFASLYFSFTNFNIINFSPRLVGLDNYIELFSADPLFWTSIGNSIRYAALLVVAATIFDIFIAYLLSLDVKYLSIYRTIFFFPVLVPVVAASLTWVWILNPRFGLMNGLLDLIGVKGPNWLASPNTAMYSLIFIAVWGSGRQVIVYLSGFNDIPRQLYEAADIDGASGLQKFRRITLPLITPQMFFNVVTLIIFSFAVILRGLHHDRRRSGEFHPALRGQFV